MTPTPDPNTPMEHGASPRRSVANRIVDYQAGLVVLAVVAYAAWTSLLVGLILSLVCGAGLLAWTRKEERISFLHKLGLFLLLPVVLPLGLFIGLVVLCTVKVGS
jgi:hypothetical protein